MKYVSQILSTLNKLQEKIRGNIAGSSSPPTLAPEHVQPSPPDTQERKTTTCPSPNKINDYVYEVCKSARRPSVEIVFFHGLQLENLSSKDTHPTTWISSDGSELWLKWLLHDFPDARILTVSYQGLDMYLTGENLIHSFTRCETPIGQDGCPVVLVGHCLGGLVMKELCVQASSILSLNPRDEPDEVVDNLLLNVRGVFTYASPHHGSKLVDNNAKLGKRHLFEDCTTLNNATARRNEKFRKLRKKYGWKAFGIGESKKVTLENLNFTGIVVPESSARHDVDGFYTVAADHFNVCRPTNRHSDSFQLLVNFIAHVLKEDKLPEVGLLAGLEIIGLDSSIERVQEKLLEARGLGIVGMAGIGKTTLAKALFDKISRDFEYACFLEKIKDKIGDEENPSKLRQKIMDGLKKGGQDVPKPFEWLTLEGKKVLIILDDIEFESHVNVMESNKYFSRESRVIVTTRNGRIIHQLNFELLEHRALDLNDSKTLFCLHAFDRRVAHPKYEDQVTKFAEKCAGLPLALKVSGRYLYNQTSKAMWDGALETLRKARPLNGSIDKDGLWSILRISFDSLAYSEQKMFLDVATYLYNQKLKDAQRIWSVCSWGTPNGWLNLLDRNLVSVDQHGLISMHEMLYDMGRAKAGDNRQMKINLQRLLQLSEEEKKTVKELRLLHSKLWEDDLALWHDELALWDRFKGYYSNQGYFNGSALFGLRNLEILHVCQGLPHGQVSHFLPKLAVLMVSGSARSLFNTGDWMSSKLEEECKKKKKKHEEEELIALQNLCEVQSLRYVLLRHLDIRHLPRGLCPVSSQLIYLEIRHCNFLKALPVEFGQLQRLKYLSIKWCRLLKTFPDSFVHLVALEKLKLRACGSLESLPVEFGQLRQLHCLSIKGCESLKELPDSFVHLNTLEILKIYACRSLKSLPVEFGQLKRLHRVSIRGCYSLQELPESFVCLDALENLEIHACNSLVALPIEFGQLRQLLSLSIKACHSLEKLSDSFVHLDALENLEIDACRSLISLPVEFGQIQGLRHLSITNCWSLEELLISCALLDALEELTIQDCSNLEISWPCLHNLRFLQRLHISNCKKITTPAGWYALSSTRSDKDDGHIRLDSFEKLRSDSDDGLRSDSNDGLLWVLSKFSVDRLSLKELDLMRASKDDEDLVGVVRVFSCLAGVSSCGSLANLRKSMGQCQKVKRLEIQGWTGEVMDLQSFDELQELTIKDSDLLELHKFSMQLSALQHLKITSCNYLEALPQTLRHVQAPKILEITECSFLKYLPNALGDLSALERLEIRNCYSLKALPETLGDLQALQHLVILNCWSLEALPNTVGHLQALQVLEIIGSKSLKALPDTLGDLLELQRLVIVDCDSLEALSDTLGHLQALQQLEISNCGVLVSLPVVFGQLQRLCHLSITNCWSLNELLISFPLLHSLEELTIGGCPELEISLPCLRSLRFLQYLHISDCKRITSAGWWYSLSFTSDSDEELRLGSNDGLRSDSDDGLLWVLSKFNINRLSVQDLDLMRASEDDGDLVPMVRVLCRSSRVSYCGSLANLPKSMGKSQTVKRLEIQGWTGEVMDLQNFDELQELTIKNIDLLELHKFSMQLSALQCLKIVSCGSLQAPTNTLGHLQALQVLEITGCESLKTLPDTLGHLQALQVLEISRCESLKALPDTLGDLQALQRLVIVDCHLLEALPDSLGHLQALQHLEIRRCWSFEALPDTLGHLQALQHLVILCGSLEALPDTLGDLQALQHLEISRCWSLKALPGTLGHLQALQHLVISCDSLEALPDTLGHLQALQQLEISRCWSLKALPDTLGHLQALQQLKISRCWSLKALPDTVGHLQALQQLEISRCRCLKALPDTLGNLWALQCLVLDRSSLVALPDTLGHLRPLVRLELI